MPRGVPNSACLITTFLIFLAGGGGGGTQPPPPQPDFTIGLSTTMVTIAQGSSSAPVNVSVNGVNGFSGSVQVTLSGVPAGVTSNPASPFSVSTGEPASVIVGAAPSAAGPVQHIRASDEWLSFPFRGTVADHSKRRCVKSAAFHLFGE